MFGQLLSNGLGAAKKNTPQTSRALAKVVNMLAPELSPRAQQIILANITSCGGKKACLDSAFQVAYRNPEFRAEWDSKKDSILSIANRQRDKFLARYFPTVKSMADQKRAAELEAIRQPASAFAKLSPMPTGSGANAFPPSMMPMTPIAIKPGCVNQKGWRGRSGDWNVCTDSCGRQSATHAGAFGNTVVTDPQYGNKNCFMHGMADWNDSGIPGDYPLALSGADLPSTLLAAAGVGAVIGYMVGGKKLSSAAFGAAIGTVIHNNFPFLGI